MTKFLFLGKSLPLVLHFDRLIAPLLSDNLGNLRIGKAWVLSYDLSLMMLAI